MPRIRFIFLSFSLGLMGVMTTSVWAALPPPAVNPLNTCFLLAIASSPTMGGDVLADPMPNCPQDDQLYEEGTWVVLTAVPAANYYFDYWEDDVLGINVTATVQMDENKSAVAVFDTTLDCYLLMETITPTGAGAIQANTPFNCQNDAGHNGWLEGTIVQLEATANTGYDFSHWSGSSPEATGSSNPVNIPFVDGDQQVTAHFETDTCFSLTINVNPTVAGTVFVQPAQECPGGWQANTPITLTATVDDPATYFFANWSGVGYDLAPELTNGSAVSDTTIYFNLNADRAINANFDVLPDCYGLDLVSYVKDADGNIIPNSQWIGGSYVARPVPNCGNGTWVDGTVITLYATPNPGYEFLEWDIDDGVPNSTTTLITLTMDASYTDANGNKTGQFYFGSTGNDVMLQKSATSQVAVGDYITYTLQITNNGRHPANGVYITDNLPPGMIYNGYSSVLGSCTHAGDIVICHLGTLPAGPGISTTVSIFVKTTRAGSFTNQATVTALEVDPYPPNNTDIATTTVIIIPYVIAVNDHYTVTEDMVYTVAVTGVLSNDSSPNPLTATVTIPPTQGQLTAVADGSFVYTPTLNFNGIDYFTYIASDGVLTDTALVTLTVTAINDAPVAANDTFTTTEDTPLSIPLLDLLANDDEFDGEALQLVASTNPMSGTLAQQADSFVYTPTLNFNGIDYFTYIASDGVLTDTAVVSLTILPVNDMPLAAADFYTTSAGITLTVSAPGVLSNDVDVETTGLTATLHTAPVSGTLTLNADGSFVYTPQAGFYGSDQFTYVTHDGETAAAPATVVIEVQRHRLYLPFVMAGDD